LRGLGPETLSKAAQEWPASRTEKMPGLRDGSLTGLRPEMMQPGPG